MMVSGRMAAQRGVDVTFGEHAHPSHALAQLTLVPGVGKPHESGPLTAEGRSRHHGDALLVQQHTAEPVAIHAAGSHVHERVERALRLDQAQRGAAVELVQHDLPLGAVFLAHGRDMLLRAGQRGHGGILRRRVDR